MRFKTQPFKHQVQALEFAMRNPKCALFMEMGTGKTWVTLNRIANTPGLKKAIVVCPLGVVPSWERQIKEHSYLTYNIAQLKIGSRKAKRLMPFVEDTQITICNFAFVRGMVDELVKLKEAGHFDMIVVDESTRIKAPKAQITSRMINLGQGIEHKMILSGWPIVNTELDLFFPFQFLDEGKTFGTSFYQFKKAYFEVEEMKYVAKQHAPERIAAMIQPSTFRVKKSECLDLPPKIYQTVSVPLSEEQEKMYHALQADYEYEFDGVGTLSIMYVFTMMTRLAQITSGFVGGITQDGQDSTDKVTHVFPKNPKLEALEELLRGMVRDHKVVIWARFHHDIQAIVNLCRTLGIRGVQYHGRIPAAEKKRGEDLFRDDPNVRVFVGHPRSGGMGLNLQVSSYVINYSHEYSPEARIQSEDRSHRIGSEIHWSIVYVDLLAITKKGLTIDHGIRESHIGKFNLAKRVLDNKGFVWRDTNGEGTDIQGSPEDTSRADF